jgi:hypothetical protein
MLHYLHRPDNSDILAFHRGHEVWYTSYKEIILLEESLPGVGSLAMRVIVQWGALRWLVW